MLWQLPARGGYRITFLGQEGKEVGFQVPTVGYLWRDAHGRRLNPPSPWTTMDFAGATEPLPHQPQLPLLGQLLLLDQY